MGQQQLLLLVLGTIINGLALVVGINTFTIGLSNSNEISVRKDIIYIASKLEQFYKPLIELGGGILSFPSSLSFPNIGLYFIKDGGEAGATFSNLNGMYSLSVANKTVTINGTGREAGVSLFYTLTANAVTKTFTLLER